MMIVHNGMDYVKLIQVGNFWTDTLDVVNGPRLFKSWCIR